MRLGDSPEQAAFRAELRAWLSAHAPHREAVPRRYETEELLAWSKALHEAGYAGLTWPVACGGRALAPAHQAVFAEESALAGSPDHINVVGLNMAGPTIIRYGTAAQRALLPRILSAEALFCQGFSEPEAGSDLAAVHTRAAPVSGGYVIDGVKLWSSYAHLADYCLLLARTDPGAPRHRGLTCFLLDMRSPGVRVRPLREMSGDSDFTEIVLTGVRVPGEAVLGPVDGGWEVALTTLAHERGTFAMTLVARLSAELGRLVCTARVLGAAGDPWVRREIAAVHVELQGMRFTSYRSLAALQRTGAPGPESSILKLRWSLANQRLTALAVRLLGGRGAEDGAAAFWGGYWQRQLLRARTSTIEGGTSEILRGIVAERVLGLPRSH
jgi:alkylation response protein AidB-like acyl-CoA dehydrogenase